MELKGRVTIPTDLDIVPETIVMEQSFLKSSKAKMLKYIKHITQQEKIMYGLKHILKKFNKFM